MSSVVDGTNPLVRQDLDDLKTRWDEAMANGDPASIRRAFEALDDYVRARDPPNYEGLPDGLVVRVEKEDPL